MPEYIDRSRYMKDRYNCDLLMIEGVELVPLHQIIDKLEQSVSLDRIKEAREEIADRIDNYPDRRISEYEDCLAILDKLITEVEGTK